MISLKRLGATIFALAATSAAYAGGLTIESRSLGLAPNIDAQIEIPDRFVPIDIPDEPGIAMRLNSDERPIDISDREDRPTLQTRMFETEAVLRCRIDSESADSLIVANAGSDPVVAGTTIKWQVRTSGERGFFSLSKDLRAGQAVRARDVLSGDIGNGGKCSAKAV